MGGVVEILEIQVPDDCMYPTLDAGDRVLVDRRRRKLEHDALYLLQTERGSHVRRIVLLSDWLARIVCDNQVYPSREANVDQLKIVGRVIWSSRLFV